MTRFDGRGESVEPGQAHLYDLPPSHCEYINYEKSNHVATPLDGPAGLRELVDTLAWVESHPRKAAAKKAPRKRR